MPEQPLTTVHHRVLTLFRDQKIEHGDNEYKFKIEEQGGRLDLPNPHIVANKKDPGQRTKGLCYTDAILVGKTTPRLLVEIVDSSPKSPNGITGLVVNADRIAAFYECKLDLVFIVLSGMKEFYCAECEAGHRLSTAKYNPHFQQSWQGFASDLKEILHEGVPEQYRKSLFDYPIKDYLKKMAPPSILFLNKKSIKDAWDTYEPTARNLVMEHIGTVLDGEATNSVRFVAIEELIPAEFKHLIPQQHT
jgi:hypothetical protein